MTERILAVVGHASSRLESVLVMVAAPEGESMVSRFDVDVAEGS